MTESLQQYTDFSTSILFVVGGRDSLGHTRGAVVQGTESSSLRSHLGWWRVPVSPVGWCLDRILPPSPISPLVFGPRVGRRDWRGTEGRYSCLPFCTVRSSPTRLVPTPTTTTRPECSEVVTPDEGRERGEKVDQPKVSPLVDPSKTLPRVTTKYFTSTKIS